MKKSLAEIKKHKALDVFRMVLNGEKLGDACKKAEISMSEYRRYMIQSGELSNIIQRAMSETTIVNIAQILEARSKMLASLIEDFDKGTIPEKLAIMKMSEVLLEKLVSDARIGAGDAGAADDILSGPTFQDSRSRYTTNDTDQGIIDIPLEQ